MTEKKGDPKAAQPSRVGCPEPESGVCHQAVAPASMLKSAAVTQVDSSEAR
jgi:hypothetical protein